MKWPGIVLVAALFAAPCLAWADPMTPVVEIEEEVYSLGVKVISDGYFWRPVRHLGMTWVPQQLWRFRPFPGGVRIVSYHANAFGERDSARLASDLERYRVQLADLHELLDASGPPGLTVLDRLFAWTWTRAVRAKRRLAW